MQDIYYVVQESGYVGEEDVHESFSYDDCLAAMHETYTESEIEELHVMIRMNDTYDF